MILRLFVAVASLSIFAACAEEPTTLSGDFGTLAYVVEIPALSSSEATVTVSIAETEITASTTITEAIVLDGVLPGVPIGQYVFSASMFVSDTTDAAAVVSATVDIAVGKTSTLLLRLGDSSTATIESLVASASSIKTNETLTLTATITGGDVAAYVWEDNCYGDYESKDGATATWSSLAVENCTLSLTIGSGETTDTAEIQIAVEEAKGSISLVAGSTCYQRNYDTDSYGESLGTTIPDGTKAKDAQFFYLDGMDIDKQDRIVFVDRFGGRVFRVDTQSGSFERIAGVTEANYDENVSGDGGPATAAEVYWPFDVGINGNTGDISIISAWDNTVRTVYANSGTIFTVIEDINTGYNTGIAVSGQGSIFASAAYTYSGTADDNGTEPIVRFNAPDFSGTELTDDTDSWDLELYSGKVYYTDRFDNRVYHLPQNGGERTRIAGNGEQGYSGDGGPALEASFFDVRGLWVDKANGDVYVADRGNNAIRKITAGGTVSTVATTLGAPTDVVMDSARNLYYTERSTCTLRKIAGPF